MNERDKELAMQAGFYLYDLTETHEIKTVETNSLDEWVTLQKFADLIRADEREACANVCAEQGELKGYGPLECANAILARGNT